MQKLKITNTIQDLLVMATLSGRSTAPGVNLLNLYGR
jgi:hypothetical protein